MTKTTYYELNKPESTDTVDVSKLNENADTMDTELYNLSGALAVVQLSDTATVDIAEGTYVLWKGTLCKASEAIVTGDTLSISNLTTVSGGAMNEIGNIISGSQDTQSYSGGGVTAKRVGKICQIAVNGTKSLNAWGLSTLTTLPAEMKPDQATYFALYYDKGNTNAGITVSSDGKVNLVARDTALASGQYYSGGGAYICAGSQSE